MNDPTHLQVGTIRRAHGVRGELRVEPTTDRPEARFESGHSLWIGGTAHTVQAARPQPDGSWLVKLSGVDTREEARGLLGAEISAPREGDELMRDDLVGFSVQSGGEILGEVLAVENAGSVDFLVVAGSSLLIPLVADLGVSIDREGRKVVIEELERIS